MKVTPSTLAVVGFPKCGTSALLRELGSRPGVEILKAQSGSIELAWPSVKTLETEASLLAAGGRGARFICHKYAGYIYNSEALTYLSEREDRKFIICIRDPSKSLVSWWKMHTDIARNGLNKNHRVYKERDFYANCTLEEYYNRSAKRLLRYDRFINRLVDIAGVERCFALSQERMASNTALAADQVLEFAAGSPLPTSAGAPPPSHVSYAQKAKVDIPKEITLELDRVYGATLLTLVRRGVRSLI